MSQIKIAVKVSNPKEFEQLKALYAHLTGSNIDHTEYNSQTFGQRPWPVYISLPEPNSNWCGYMPGDSHGRQYYQQNGYLVFDHIPTIPESLLAEKVDVAEHKVIVDSGEMVQVGCTNVSFEEVEALYNAMKKVRDKE